MSVWTSEAGVRAETFAEPHNGEWVPVIQWSDGREMLKPAQSEAAAIAMADEVARQVLHPWYVQSLTPAAIRAARDTLGITQAEFARWLGYADPSRISNLERGVRIPSTAVLLLIEAYLAGYRRPAW